jgi:RHS repeat-associated protein
MLWEDNKLMSKRENSYDFSGNLVERKEGLHTVRFGYSNRHHLLSYTRAFGTPCARTTSFSYTPSGLIASKAYPDQTKISYSYDAWGNLSTIRAPDIEQEFHYNLSNKLLSGFDRHNKCGFERILNPSGNILKETFSHGLEISKAYDAFERPLTMDISEAGTIAYSYDPLHLKSITHGLYTHQFESYDLDGNLLVEKSPESTIQHAYDGNKQHTSIQSPYFSEAYQYDACGNLISDGETYDPLSQLNRDKYHIYNHDTVFNRTAKDGRAAQINELHELLSIGNVHCRYDLRGNLIYKQNGERILEFTYDSLNRLILAKTPVKEIHYQYDPLGRCVSKTTAEGTRNYIYDLKQEIGSFADKLLELRLMGKHTVAIELQGQVCSAYTDYQGNVRKLVNQQQTICEYGYTAFGEAESNEMRINPWGYAGKRLDPDTNLINFGHRHYDPKIGRWLTPDPEGFIDSINLYQYCFNNPYRYADPDGRFVIVLPLLTWAFGGSVAISSLTSIGTVAVGSMLLWGGYKLTETLNQSYHEGKLLHSIENLHENIFTKIDKKNKKNDPTEKPRYSGEELGTDPTKCPDEGFEWKGKGNPESGEGAWFNPKTKETLHPDLEHPLPEQPHWDYINSGKEKAKLYLDGTFIWE